MAKLETNPQRGAGGAVRQPLVRAVAAMGAGGGEPLDDDVILGEELVDLAVLVGHGLSVGRGSLAHAFWALR